MTSRDEMATPELERLARVLCAESGEPESCAKFYRNAARAVLIELVAMASEEKGMIEAGVSMSEECKDSDWDSGGDGESCNSYEYYRSDAPSQIFTAMLRHVLRDEGGGA